MILYQNIRISMSAKHFCSCSSAIFVQL